MHTSADWFRQESGMLATLRRIAVVLVCVASAFTCKIVLAEPLYRFGVPPWQRGQSVDDIRRLYEPLVDYLGRATNASLIDRLRLSRLASHARGTRTSQRRLSAMMPKSS